MAPNRTRARVAAQGSNKQPSYWLPLKAVADAFTASLAGGSATANKAMTLQDPVDSVNLRGKITGGGCEVWIRDAAASLVGVPPRVYLALFPPNIAIPATLPVATLKSNEDFMWYSTMCDQEPVPNGTSTCWIARFRPLTDRWFRVKGTRLVIIVENNGAVAFGAASATDIHVDLYCQLD